MRPLTIVILATLSTLTVACNRADPTKAEEIEEPSTVALGTKAPPNRIHFYARLFAPQSEATAHSQYLPDLQQALTNYQDPVIHIEEIRGAQDTIESIGIRFDIPAPDAETESIEQLLIETLRQSGAPYATQVYVVQPNEL
ncbi:MAG: hypothetical protein ACI9R3_000615 [Verrucomicrobiales bacterium]|jgi:hypothetical protein